MNVIARRTPAGLSFLVFRAIVIIEKEVPHFAQRLKGCPDELGMESPEAGVYFRNPTAYISNVAAQYG